MIRRWNDHEAIVESDDSDEDEDEISDEDASPPRMSDILAPPKRPNPAAGASRRR